MTQILRKPKAVCGSSNGNKHSGGSNSERKQTKNRGQDGRRNIAPIASVGEGSTPLTTQVNVTITTIKATALPAPEEMVTETVAATQDYHPQHRG